MAGEANIWNPRTLVAISADTKSVEEKITAAAAQTLFTITDFIYVVGTGALEIHKNGLLLTKGTDWVEQTGTTFALVAPATAGDIVVASGHVGITGAVDVRDTDIYVTNYQAIRDYAGTESTLYSQGQVTAGDGGEHFFQEKTGAAPGTYVDDGNKVLVPTGGDGSAGWIRTADHSTEFVTLASAIASLQISAGDVIVVADRGWSKWDVVLASTVTTNTYNIVQAVGKPLLAFVLRVKSTTHIAEWGASAGASAATNAGAIQAAMTSVLCTVIEFTPVITYIVAAMVPISYNTLNLNGATLFLADNTLAPMFFDGGVGVASDFSVNDGILDCNQAGGNKNINVVGGIWLTTFDRISFTDLKIINCYRVGLSLIGCSYINIKNYRFEDSGIDLAAHFAYGLELTAFGNVTRYINIDGFSVSNVAGYGMHLYGCTDVYAQNLNFFNLDFASGSIGITVTEVLRGVIKNVSANLVSGDSIEINDSEDIELTNCRVASAGNRALLLGQNTAPFYNKRIKVTNFESVSTGGAFAAAISHCQDATFENIIWDKKITSDSGATLSKNMHMSNVDINDVFGASSNIATQGRFDLRDIRFTDYTVKELSDTSLVIGLKATVANAGVLNLPIELIAAGQLLASGAVAGTLDINSKFTSSATQGSHQKLDFLVNSAGTAANLSPSIDVANAVSRVFTVTGDAAGKQLVMTNSSGVDLLTTVELRFTLFA
tara:strand:+ start:587 stop:2740 length:2154 start_codon:yes stop_codon:yes gene_type:complete